MLVIVHFLRFEIQWFKSSVFICEDCLDHSRFFTFLYKLYFFILIFFLFLELNPQNMEGPRLEVELEL